MKIGIDIGGSHIACGLVEDGKIIAKKEHNFTKTDKDNIKQQIEKIIVSFLSELLEQNNLKIEDIEKIGIASPGIVINNIIYGANNLNIHEYDLTQVLRKYYNVPILIQNDGICSAMCEKKYGSLNNYKDCIFLCLGTGIGGAVFVDGKLTRGNELGHMVIQKNGIPCTCGKNGCFERYASMKTLKDKLSVKLKMPEDTLGEVLLQGVKENKYNKEIIQIIDEYTDNLAVGLANLIDMFKPEAISLGGSFVHYKEILLDKLIEKLKIRKSNFNIKMPEIVLSKNKNDAGIIGASEILG